MELKFYTMFANKLYPSPTLIFDKIVEESKDMAANEGYNYLWGNVFGLNKIYVLMEPMEDISKVKEAVPLIGKMNGKKSFMLFTDHKHVQDFANRYDMKNKKEEILVLELNPLKDLEWFTKLESSGVYNVIFNHGDFSWIIETEALKQLQEYFDCLNLANYTKAFIE